MDVAFYLYAVTALVLTANALRRPSPRSRFPTWWLPAMIIGELAGPLFFARLGVGALFWAIGGWEGSIGRLAAGFWAVSLIGLGVIIVRTQRVAAKLNATVAPKRRVDASWSDMFRRPNSVELECHVPYSADLTLDVYQSKSHNGRSSPTLLYVHGGGWTGGDPHRQAKTMFRHLAGRGWLVLTIRYPLAPAATFPAQVVAVKQAIAWAKSTGLASGVDPNRIVLAGGSAGGHLASLAALTSGDPSFQPGFGDVDTSVAGCIPIYGVYDFLNRNRTRPDWMVIPRAVMKASAAEAPDAYRRASPLDQVHAGAPPFLVVHGANDSLVPPLEARQFVSSLGAVSESAVRYVEVGGAQHAFDAIDSPRTRAVVGVITEFLETEVLLPGES